MKRSAPRFAFVVITALAALACRGEENSPQLQPLFPNHAMLITPTAASRLNPAGPVDTDLPFSWTQTVLLREGATSLRVIGGFDPGFQQVLIDILPTEPVNVKVEGVDGQTGQILVTARGKTAGLMETFLFRVRARDITNDELFSLIYDIREENSRIRGTPLLLKSPGDFVKPGQIVRYVWSRTGLGEKRPKCEAQFVGRTGPSKGITSSTITEVLAVKAQPFVLGHYLMTVTPRDVRGEPARGSTSNGQVFRCAFGSQNLPPVTDGISADTFLPAVGQVVTMAPVAFDPETGISTFDNETWDFGDGTIVTGISGATTHAYALPGIYRVRCTVADAEGLTATAEDTIVVGATVIPKMSFSSKKEIIPEEAGIGVYEEDNLSATFPGISAVAGDRVIFSYNRNRFGRVSASDGGDADIVLKAGGGFTGPGTSAKNITAQGGKKSVSVSVSRAQLDRTGDPRFGRAETKGVFKHQRIACCVIPADGSTPRAVVYTGNVQIKVKGGDLNRFVFVPEEKITAKSTTKEPNPKKQEIVD